MSQKINDALDIPLVSGEQINFLLPESAAEVITLGQLEKILQQQKRVHSMVSIFEQAAEEIAMLPCFIPGVTRCAKLKRTLLNK